MFSFAQPLNKGLEPIKIDGLAQPMITSCIAATFYHLFNSTSISSGVIAAPKKAQVIVAVFFIVSNLYASGLLDLPTRKPSPTDSAKLSTKKNK